MDVWIDRRMYGSMKSSGFCCCGYLLLDFSSILCRDKTIDVKIQGEDLNVFIMLQQTFFHLYFVSVILLFCLFSIDIFCYWFVYFFLQLQHIATVRHLVFMPISIKFLSCLRQAWLPFKLVDQTRSEQCWRGKESIILTTDKQKN